MRELRGRLNGGRGSQPRVGGLGLPGGGSYGDSQQAAIRSSNSARTRSSSLSTRSAKASCSAMGCSVTGIGLTPSAVTYTMTARQASICLRSPPLAVTAILRGLACSAIGIVSVRTPTS
jgi:hypothetical protein